MEEGFAGGEKLREVGWLGRVLGERTFTPGEAIAAGGKGWMV